MANLLERSIASIDERLVVLAPPARSIPAAFGRVTVDAGEHDRLLREMQRLRGMIYQRDGAVSARDLVDGRHRTVEDDRSWHLLMLDAGRRRVDACIWYLEHANTIPVEGLRVRHCPMAAAHGSRDVLRSAVHSELQQARREAVAYSEVGGWAVAPTSRCTPDGLLLILATFGLSRVMGGALGLATATVRHSSAAILRRLGLSQLDLGTATGAYYDPQYDCEMELLRFDTRRASPKYHGLIEQLKERLSSVPVLVSSIEPAAAAA
jgi:hypothetical protein